MAGRKFSFFESYAAMLDQLSDAQCAEFVRAMYRWAFQGEEPSFSDQMLQFAWPSIAEQITAGIEISERMAEYGKRGGRPKKGPKKPSKKPSFNGAKSLAKSLAKSQAESLVKATGQDWTGQDMNMSSPRTGRDASPSPRMGSARIAGPDSMTEEEYDALVGSTPTMRE